MIKRVLCLQVLCVVFFTLALGASAQTNALAVEPVNDYGAGFNMLHKFGAPDATGATYVKLNFLTGHPNNYDASASHMMRMMKREGTGWLVLSSSTNEPHRYISGVSVVDIYDREVVRREQLEARRKALAKARSGESGQPVSISYDSLEHKASATWKEIDPVADVQTVLEYLDKMSGDRYMQSQLSQMSGFLFIDAAHLYQNGFTNEANRITERLFTAIGDRQQVILSGLNAIADDRLRQVSSQFFEDSDWDAYHEGLLRLLKTFRSGWQKAPAVKRLLVAVQDRIQNPDAPLITGETLTDTDAEIAAGMCKLSSEDMAGGRSMFYSSMSPAGTLWILQAPQTNETSEVSLASAGMVSSNAYSQILLRGKDSVPLLMALLDDSYLLTLGRNSIGGGSYSYYSSRSGLSPEKEELRIYNSLDRPISRGELAMSLLKVVVPKGNQSSYESMAMTPEEFAPVVKDWYQVNKDKTSSDLALLYMEQGDSQQRSSAIRYLSQYGGESDLAKIEKIFLEADWQEYAHMIPEYIRQRGDKATEFVQQYTNLLSRTVADGTSNSDWAKQMLTQIERVLDTSTVYELLDQLVAGDKSYTELQSILHSSTYQEKDKAKLFTAILDAAIEVEDTTASVGLISMLSNLQQYSGMGRQLGMSWSFDINDDLERWKKLLADERVATSSPGYPGRKIADSAAFTLLSLEQGADRTSIYSLSSLGARGRTWVMKRAMALVEETDPAELPPVPSALDVSESKVSEVLDTISLSEDVEAFVNELPLDVLLALQVPFAEQSNLWKRVVRQAHTVQEVTIDPDLIQQFGWLRDWESKRLDDSVLDRLIENCMEVASSGKYVSVAAIREPILGGIHLQADVVSSNSPSASAWLNRVRNEDSKGRVRVRAMLYAPRISATADWFSEEATVAADETEASESTGDELLLDALEFEMSLDQSRGKEASQEELREKMKVWLEGACNVYPQASLVVIGSPPSTPEESNSDVDVLMGNMMF